ncbi:hypothetical protein BDN72DRAFT_903849 [Pluteus cervinus]|uniref:Uncharacterized protein n=1 Tax=Pluteus cervinus TaxID=181527 RepID=A0ACD3A781_9AGAR|nr:hypothetical protein BDN72DRAFT_903849 [Pluteus cervinus]
MSQDSPPPPYTPRAPSSAVSACAPSSTVEDGARAFTSVTIRSSAPASRQTPIAAERAPTPTTPLAARSGSTPSARTALVPTTPSTLPVTTTPQAASSLGTPTPQAPFATHPAPDAADNATEEALTYLALRTIVVNLSRATVTNPPAMAQDAEDRWYTILRGRCIGVVKGWSLARRLTAPNPWAFRRKFSTRQEAVNFFLDELELAHVRILVDYDE